jgi:hypothetical protein
MDPLKIGSLTIRPPDKDGELELSISGAARYVYISKEDGYELAKWLIDNCINPNLIQELGD